MANSNLTKVVVIPKGDTIDIVKVYPHGGSNSMTLTKQQALYVAMCVRGEVKEEEKENEPSRT